MPTVAGRSEAAHGAGSHSSFPGGKQSILRARRPSFAGSPPRPARSGAHGRCAALRCAVLRAGRSNSRRRRPSQAPEQSAFSFEKHGLTNQRTPSAAHYPSQRVSSVLRQTAAIAPSKPTHAEQAQNGGVSRQGNGQTQAAIICSCVQIRRQSVRVPSAVCVARCEG